MDDPTAELTAPRYASFWKRLYAYGYDSLIVTVLSVLVGMQLPRPAQAAYSPQQIDAMVQMSLLPPGTTPDNLLQTLWSQSTASLSWMDIALPILLSAIYNIAFICGEWQATPGKRFCGIYVTNAEGGRLTLAQSVARHAASSISMIALSGLGYLTIFFTPKKLALHDMICATRVVLGKRN